MFDDEWCYLDLELFSDCEFEWEMLLENLTQLSRRRFLVAERSPIQSVFALDRKNRQYFKKFIKLPFSKDT